MKDRHPLHEFIKRTAGLCAAGSLLFGQTFSLFAGPTGDSKHSEEAVKHLKHIIVIYQENWSFDSLYGQFPGASGYALGFDTLPQYDVHASPPYSALIYKTPRPLTGFPLAPDPQFPAIPDGTLGW